MNAQEAEQELAVLDGRLEQAVCTFALLVEEAKARRDAGSPFTVAEWGRLRALRDLLLEVFDYVLGPKPRPEVN